MSTVSRRDREKALDELESFYESKLAAVRAKRTGHSEPPVREGSSSEEPVRVHVNPRRRQVILTWE
jgi:hypothetical protein